MALAATLDHVARTPEDVAAWTLVLADVDYPAAEHALLAHFADPDRGLEFLRPAHITRQLRASEPTVALPPTLEAAAATECDLHTGYPLPCEACVRWPSDRTDFELLGVRPELTPLADAEALAEYVRTIEES